MPLRIAKRCLPSNTAVLDGHGDVNTLSAELESTHGRSLWVELAHRGIISQAVLVESHFPNNIFIFVVVGITFYY